MQLSKQTKYLDIGEIDVIVSDQGEFDLRVPCYLYIVFVINLP